MKEEIVGGLKNALERGDSLEHAMLTMINAGYNREEVLAAAKILPYRNWPNIVRLAIELK